MAKTPCILIGFALCASFFQAHAGPPLICHPYSIGSAQSLPWGDGTARGWDNADPKYNTQQLSTDTLKILDANAPVLVRMETMRRAAIYGAKDHAAAASLLGTLKQRAAAPDAGAYTNFDYGYFVETIKQIQWLYKDDITGGANGYEFVKKALAMQDSPEMHFAAAMITADSRRPDHGDYETHMRSARAAKTSALLAANLASHQ